MPARIAIGSSGSRRGPAETADDKKAGKQQKLQQEEGSQRGAPDRFQAADQQSCQAEHQHEDQHRQHRRDRRLVAANQMRGQDHQVAGDVGGEQATKPDEADGIHASRNDAE
jgi:hypothetical protein